MTGVAAAERRVVLALGSNQGDRLANLQRGLEILAAEPGFDAAAVSSVYETSPVGGPDQPEFLNAAVLAVSSLPARFILDRCLAAEHALGRVRNVTWGPRTLDVDVIVCGEEISDDPVLTLPHPRAHQRAFVLAPWHDVEPEAHLPGAGLVADLLAEVGMDGVRPLADIRLTLVRESAGTRE